MKLTAEWLIERLGLRPLSNEGGYFAQTWLSEETACADALPGRYGRAKRLGTAIYYLLTDDPDSFSALHRLPTDEVYHFYLGDPVEMLLLKDDGAATHPMLGPDLASGQQVQLVVPRGTWQGSRLRSGGLWALLGTTMAPGFDPQDFELGDRDALARRWPAESARIERLTRPPAPAV